ncbi:MAG: hypothetical protein EOL88_02530 [Bacteroidia bacterium]|nr:hypothetical protein [Bacteroidia bacterium]
MEKEKTMKPKALKTTKENAFEENKTVYLACYSSGQYEDYEKTIVFASFSKNKVVKWVRKFNSIHLKWINYYKKLYEEDKVLGLLTKPKYEDKHFDEWYSLNKINSAFIEEVELR